jgi:hypothetical protein
LFLFVGPESLLVPVNFAKLKVPKACAILSATVGFSQTSQAYGGSGILLRLKPGGCSTEANITADLDSVLQLS